MNPSPASKAEIARVSLALLDTLISSASLANTSGALMSLSDCRLLHEILGRLQNKFKAAEQLGAALECPDEERRALVRSTLRSHGALLDKP